MSEHTEPRTDGGTVLVDRSDDGPSPESERRAVSNDDAATLVAEDLVVGYPSTDDPVIDGVSLRAPAGAVTALVGPNGSGKSTLLGALADQLVPGDGAVFVDGEEVHGLGSRERARRVGLLSQETTAPDSVTVERLVEHGRYPYRGAFGSLSRDDRQAVDRAISLAGVEHLRDRQLDSLSGGQKQLVWIAMALAQETDVLLLDEPTTYLDVRHRMAVMEVVARLRDERDVTVVVVLHDVERAARHADHLVALADGDVYDRGPPAEVVTERLLADVFGVAASVERDADGRPRVTPERTLAE